MVMAVPATLRTDILPPQAPRCLRGAFLAFFCCVRVSLAAATPDGGIDFFERQIRPILVEQCYTCHSAQAEKVKGGLRVDTRPALLQGGDSGPALVPGKPDESILIRAVRHESEELRMPKKKLGAEQVAALEDWVRMGAPDPRDAATPTQAKSKTVPAASGHWAFQPIRHPAIPEVRDRNWVREPVDAFILAKLESKGLTPSPEAGRRTLIRRVTFDLTGLPPTPEEVSLFAEDESPDAYARLVERLLGSPQYGERWARHWLDVARYADTKGYVFEEERRYPYAYTYRDYVIRAFNEDLPFDRFIVEQIAADRLPLGEDKRPLAALGYLTLGRRFLNNPQDIIDDRIDVVTRGMMGLTVACARCHDHKYDPITAQDYYGLSGVFASSSEPEEKPLLGGNGDPSQYLSYVEAHEKRLKELDGFRAAKEAEIRSQLRRLAGAYLLAAHDIQAGGGTVNAEALARERQLDPGIVDRWIKKLDEWKSEGTHPVFAPWFALEDCPEAQFPLSAEALRQGGGGTGKPILNPVVTGAFGLSALTSLREAADRYGALFAEVEGLWEQTLSTAAGQMASERSKAPPATGLPDPALEEVRQVLYAADSPTTIDSSEITRLFDVPSIQKLRALKRKVEEVDATHPGAPARAMALQDNPTPTNPRVLVRGNPGNPGVEVPRQFLAFLAGEKPQPFQQGSGRLELAQAIASGKNPLTARVVVNRVWLHYFGVGLVRTPSDFGLRSDPPSHPELLDYLASRFIDERWSIKQLQRWIVLSSVYRQSSADIPANAQIDPANQLLWKMNRRRLDFEATRDALLAVAGRLDTKVGGLAVEITTEPSTPRRTIYGFVERQNLPGIFRTFDFASPDTTSPQRFSTTVPQQALFLINSPFVVHRAQDLVRRVSEPDQRSDTERVRSLYRLAYQREPDAREKELAMRYIASQELTESGKSHDDSQSRPVSATGLTAWDRYAQVLLMSNEFVFLD